MTRKEFESLRLDMIDRFPSMADMDDNTWRLWYVELFAPLDAAETRAKLNEWWRQAKGPKTSYERDNFGPQLAAAVGEIHYRRQQQHELSRETVAFVRARLRRG